MPDVSTSGLIGDMTDAVRRGARGIRDEASSVIDSMRAAYERERQRRMLRLLAVVGVAYLLLRNKR